LKPAGISVDQIMMWKSFVAVLINAHLLTPN
jgi:hypothetical protein